MQTTRKPADGWHAEEAAAQFLRAAGLRVLERNWRCRLGEIDIVARDGEALVFVEVRLRRSQAFGGAFGSVDGAKRGRLLAAARAYLAGRREHACRFDVLAFEALEPPRIRWLRDAFGE